MKHGVRRRAEQRGAARRREAHRLAQVARPVVRVESPRRRVEPGGRSASRRSGSRGADSATLAHQRLERRDAPGPSSREWKACEVCSSSARDAVGFERVREASRSALVGPATTQALGPFSAASDSRSGRRAAQLRRRPGAPTASRRPACACISAPRRATRRAASSRRHHAGQHRGDELADAVADQRRRLRRRSDQQLARQRVFEREGGRLRDRGRRAAQSASSREHALAQVEAEHAVEGAAGTRRRRRGTPARSAYSARPMPAYCAPWPGNSNTALRRARAAIAPLARVGGSASRSAATACGRRRRRRRTARCAKRLAADAQRVGDVGERRRRDALRGARPGAAAAAASAAGVRADSCSSCGPRAGVGRRAQRRFLDDHVRVGAADAEGADAGAPRRRGARPGAAVGR